MPNAPDASQRPILVLLLGGKSESDDPSVPEVPPADHICPHCREHQLEHELAESRKFARLSGWLLVDENARQLKAKARGGVLLD
jgi:hypothetical protein